jgi:glycosyltransferase involved in cell wall biosynthesis
LPCNRRAGDSGPAADDFAVLVPAFDEAENMEALFRELRETFARHRLGGEVILVDDGSRDGTYDAAERESAGFPRVKVLRHRRNQGKTEAMVTGALAAESEYLVLFDADLQHSTEEIPRFLAELAETGSDIVCGRKVGSYEKAAVSTIYNRLSQRLFQVPARDLNSMKAFRAEILREIPLRHDWHRFFVVLAYDQGYSVSEMDIELFPRRAGVAKYSGRGACWWGGRPGRRLVLPQVHREADAVLWRRRHRADPPRHPGGPGDGGAAHRQLDAPLRLPPPAHARRPAGDGGVVLFGFGFMAELIATLRSEVHQLRRR